MLMKINKKYQWSLYLRTTKNPEAEIQALLHPAEANLGHFLVWFQSLQLPLTQSESPLAPKSHGSFKVCAQLSAEFLIFHISIRINCNRIIENLLYSIFCIPRNVNEK
jgi:hypothetical protein